MRSDKHGVQSNQRKLLILVSVALVVLAVGGTVTYLKYQEKVSMLRQVQELIVDNGLPSDWEFKHCTSMNDDCGRLE